MYKGNKLLYEFGPFRLDPAERLLLREGQPVSLTPKVFDSLLVLVENHGHLVDKSELLKRLWPDTFVEEVTLARNISYLRKALGDTADGERFIATVPKRGYRFVASVTQLTEGSEAPPGYSVGQSFPVTAAGQRIAQNESVVGKALEQAAPGVGLAKQKWRGKRLGVRLLGIGLVLLGLAGASSYLRDSSRLKDASALLGIRSIAVLPLENLSRDPEQEYFADGITEDLITNLAKISALRVISRTSVMRYKGTKKTLPEIARELNVDAVMEGTVVRSSGRVHITAQLIQARPEKHIWAESYDRPIADVVTLQGELAREIAGMIRVKLTPQEQASLATARPISPEAYEAYLKGRFYWNKRTVEGMQKAIQYFEGAIEKDPNCALAYAGLADCHALPANPLPPRERLPKAKAAAVKALEIDDTLVEGHTSLAFALMLHDLDWSGAEREFKRAIELNPHYATAHDWYAFYLVAMGRLHDAIAEAKRAQELDPVSLSINWDLGQVLYLARDYNGAIEQYHRTLEMDPNSSQAHTLLALSYGQKGLCAEAIAESQKAVAMSRGSTAPLARLGATYAQCGKRDEARKVIDQLKKLSKQRYVSAYDVAVIYAGLSQKDQAFAWLEKAQEERSFHLFWLRADPGLDPLRGDPRFDALLRRISLPP